MSPVAPPPMRLPFVIAEAAWPKPKPRRRTYSRTPDYHKEWRRRNHAKVRAAERRYISSPKGKRKMADTYRQRVYGLSVEAFDALILETGGYCPLCQNQTTLGRPYDLVVDHCHLTNQVRGLICNLCNTIIGYFENHNLGREWLLRVEAHIKP